MGGNIATDCTRYSNFRSPKAFYHHLIPQLLTLVPHTKLYIKSRSSSRIALVLLFMAIVTNVFALPYTYPSASSSFLPYAHPAVLENDAAEALYPSHLKNPFYKTPRVRAALEHFSRLSYGEQPVENRIADRVPRREIYKLLTHAGFVPRSEFPYA